MGKPNKNKNAQNASSSETKIDEPKFGEKPDTQNLSAGAKKLLLQQEKDRRDQEEADRMKKEKLEADKKKKNNKTPNKAKPKPTPSKNKEEGKPEPKPINTQNENEVKGEHIREMQRPKNARNANEDFEKPPEPMNTQHEDEDFNEAPKSEHIQNENEGKDSWLQENSSSLNEPDEAWNWTDNKSNLSSEGSNWRVDKKREIAKPNHSQNRQSGNFGNSSSGRSSFGYTLSDGKNDEEFQKFYHNKQNFHGKVREEKGDLFDAPEEYSLAHCVAEDFSMGAGIAKEFKARFRRVTQLLDQNAKTGGLAILDDKDRFIYYLVTKQVSRGKPTLYSLWKSLLKLRDHIAENKVTKLAIPQIGCGLDRLDWMDVKSMLEYVFSKTKIDIVVYILDFNADETPTPSRALRKCFVKHEVKPLADMEKETGLIFFGTEDGAVSHEMEDLAKKFDFISRYKVAKKSTSDVIKIVDRFEYLYGLIIRRTNKNRIIFADFEKCLFNLRKMLKVDQTVYIALQAFVEKDDEVITEKLVTLMQHILQDVDIYVCWPQELAKYCPPQKQY